MYKLLILLSLLSFSSFATVSQGEKISAKKFNESTLTIGTIQSSLLTELQFQSLQGNCWVKMSGQSISGSDLANLTGMTSLPNADGRFLRNTGGSAASLRSLQADAFKAHYHNQADGYKSSYQGKWGQDDLSGDFFNHSDGYAGKSLRTSTVGSSETRPINLSVNMFIKINHECN